MMNTHEGDELTQLELEAVKVAIRLGKQRGLSLRDTLAVNGLASLVCRGRYTDRDEDDAMTRAIKRLWDEIPAT